VSEKPALLKETSSKVASADRERQAFLRSNELERQKLDLEIARLEKKLGIKGAANERKRRKLNRDIGLEGFGNGFMDFIDGIGSKIK
jgi:hypothetical protein